MDEHPSTWPSQLLAGVYAMPRRNWLSIALSLVFVGSAAVLVPAEDKLPTSPDEEERKSILDLFKR